MDALRFELGLAVPGDVAVVGHDDVPVAAWPAYGLTTIRQPVKPRTSARTPQEIMPGFGHKLRDFPDHILWIAKQIQEDRRNAIPRPDDTPEWCCARPRRWWRETAR